MAAQVTYCTGVMTPLGPQARCARDFDCTCVCRPFLNQICSNWISDYTSSVRHDTPLIALL